MSVKLISLIVSYQAETDTRKPVDFDDDGKQEEEMTRTHIHRRKNYHIDAVASREWV